MDMRMLIKTLLQVQASQRPNTHQILQMPIVIQRIKKYFPGRENQFVPGLGLVDEGEVPAAAQTMESSELLRTIKLSNKVFQLSLPEPTYIGSSFSTIPGT